MTSENNSPSNPADKTSENKEDNPEQTAAKINEDIPGNDKIFVFSPPIGMFFFLMSLAMLAILVQHFSGIVRQSHTLMNLGVLVGGLAGLAYFWFLYSIRLAIVNIFSSLKATAVLLIMILLASMIGTFIIQGMTFPESKLFFASFFKWLGFSNRDTTLRYGKYLAQVCHRLYFTDIYHCLWFNTWLLVLAVNLCYSTTKNGKWVFHKLGFTLTHVGFIVLLLGGLVTGLFGVRGQVPLTEGQTASQYINERTKELEPIGFLLRLDKFTYKTWKPKRRLLSILQDKNGFTRINKAQNDYIYGKLVTKAQKKEEAVIKKGQVITISSDAIKARLKKRGKSDKEIDDAKIEDVEIKILGFDDAAIVARPAELIFGRLLKNNNRKLEEISISFPRGKEFEVKTWGLKGKVLSNDPDNPRLLLEQGLLKEERRLTRGTYDIKSNKNHKIQVGIKYIPAKKYGTVTIEIQHKGKTSAYTLRHLGSRAPFSGGLAVIPGTNEILVYQEYAPPKLYQSDISFNDKGAEMRHDRLGQSGKADEFNKKQGRGASVILNKPIKAGRFLIYQISYDEDPKTGKYTSVLLLVDEPGGWLLEAGSYIILTGMIWMLWAEPYFRRKEKKKKIQALANEGSGK